MKTTELKVQSRVHHSTYHRGWRITSRDLDILSIIYRHRFLTRRLIEWAFFAPHDGNFDKRSSLAARRLQALYEAGLLQRLVLPMLPGTGRSPAVYALSPRGADVVADHLGIDRERLQWHPRHTRATAFFMEHTLAIASIWAALTPVAAEEGLSMRQWIGEAELRQWQLQGFDRESHHWIPIRPDGYLELVREGDGSVFTYFIEVDMGTETNVRMARKLRAYQALRRNTEWTWKTVGDFGLLLVTTTRRRRENLRRMAWKALEQNFCLFALLEDIHPARIFDAWRNVKGESAHLITFRDDPEYARLLKELREKRRSAGEEDEDWDDEEDDDNDENEDYERRSYYDDEDPETWLS